MAKRGQQTLDFLLSNKAVFWSMHNRKLLSMETIKYRHNCISKVIKYIPKEKNCKFLFLKSRIIIEHTVLKRANKQCPFSTNFSVLFSPQDFFTQDILILLICFSLPKCKLCENRNYMSVTAATSNIAKVPGTQ